MSNINSPLSQQVGPQAPAATGTPAPFTPNPQGPHGQPSLPGPHDESLLGRLKHAMSRTADHLRHTRFEVSTAISQLSRHGKPFAPADFKANGVYAGKHRALSAHTAAASLAGTRHTRHETQALAKTARTPTAQSNASRAASASAGTRVVHADEVALDAMNGGAPLLAYVARYMPGPRSDPLAAAELAEGLAMQGAPAASPPTMRGALLAQALHEAGVVDAHDAAQTLDTLARLDFTQMDRVRCASQSEAQAWFAARRLARTEGGFEALEHLRSTVGNNAPHPNPLIRSAHRTMLEAADALEPDLARANHDPSPGASAARHAPLAGTDVRAAPFAWRAYDAARTLAAQSPDQMSADQKGVFFAWQQKFREDGPGTELSKARERLHKFAAKTVDRGGANRWKTYLPRIFGKHVAPQRALAYGTQGAGRGQIPTERNVLAHVLKDALPPLIDRPEMRPAAALSHARPERSIAELAALHVWLESGGFANDRPNAVQLNAIARRAQQLCAQLQPRDVGSPATLDRMQRTTAKWAAADPHDLARNGAFKPIAKRPFNIERLASWGKVAHVPDDSPFWNHIETLSRSARPPARNEIDVTNADEVCASLKDVALNLGSSARLRLTDGGRFGLSTKGLSVNISKLLQSGAVPVAPRLDLRASRSREGVIELSRDTHGVEMFLGTAKASATHAGVGLLVGYDMDVGLTQARAGITTQAVLHSQELEEPSGVSVRIARRVNANGTGYDEDAMRAKLAGVIDYVFDEVTHARRKNTGGAHGTWNRLAERYFDDPDISLSWTDSISRTVKRGASIDASLWVDVPSVSSPVRPGFTVGAGFEKIAAQTLDSIERNGRMQIEQHRVGDGVRVLGKVGGTISGNGNGNLSEGKVSVGYISLDAPAMTSTLTHFSHLAKVRLVREDNALVHRACLRDAQYSNVNAYTDDIEANRAQWVSLFTQQVEDEQRAERQLARLRGDPQPTLPPARELAESRLNTHLADVKANRRLNQTYVHRSQLRQRSARELDALVALGAQLPREGSASARARIDENVKRILNDPASWMPIELKVKERNAVTRGPGFNFLLQMHSNTSSTGEREIFAEKVPFALRERLDH